MSDEEITPPRKTIGDWLHTLTKAAVASVPWAGGPAAEIFAAIVMPPRSKRMDDWMESVVRKLEDCTMDSLQNNPAFVSAVLHGTQIAIRSHQKEKLDALRNAVLNVASGNAPDDDLQLVFLNMIDLFTPTHLQLLRVFQDRSSVSSGVIDNRGKIPRSQFGNVPFLVCAKASAMTKKPLRPKSDCSFIPLAEA